jgi:hypothetical protein
MTDCPIIPLVFDKDTYIYNSEILSKIEPNIQGISIFTKMKMKDFELYEPVETLAPEDAATADLAEAAS